MPYGMTTLDKNLKVALDNAERQLAEKYARSGFNINGEDPYSHKFFRDWLRGFWGIEVGEPREEAVLESDGWREVTHYWPVESIRDEERLVMFKLTYG